MKRFYYFLKFCFYAIIVALALSVAGISYFFFEFSKDLPKLDNLKDYNPPVVSEVFSDDGTKVGEFWLEKRLVLSPEEIPKIMEQAIVASEDDRFFEHSGIDYFGIFRAMLENVRAGHIVQGGSTITQQVVKGLVLTREKTYKRKITEAILAKKLEDKFTKKEILYLYLNQINFGNRSYGIEAAAQNYFHKSAKELTIAEAAMLAGLPKAPSKFSPIRNYERAKSRQEYVIDRMYEEGFITKDQRDKAKKIRLTIYRAPTDKEYNNRYAPWFVEEIRRMIIAQYGENAPYMHGLKIYTTLDLKAQKAADYAVERGLSELHKRHGYTGPIKKLNAEEFATFNFANHKKLYAELFDPDLVILTPDAEIKKAKTEISENKIYQGLVTDMDIKAKTVTVQVGNHTGTILPRDYGWARPRSNASSGYNGVMYITSPEKALQVGDVIEVKKVNVTKLSEADKKKYEAGKLYFSLEQTPLIEGALFSYDLESGYVKAIVGGKNYLTSEFNRATQAERQTGSVFKPFLYASALDKGYQLDTIIDDAPIRIPDGPGRYWEPKNYGNQYSGPMTFRNALVHSKNLVSVRIILDVGVEYVAGMLRKLGITTPVHKVYAMSLGSNDMKLSEVTRAFGTFGTGGILPQFIYVKKMTNRFGTVLEENKPVKIKPFTEQIKDGEYNKASSVSDSNLNSDNLRKDLWTEAQQWVKKDKLMLSPLEEILLYGNHIPEGYVMSPKTAYTMVQLMQDIVDHGTGYKVHELGRPAAGKTGTTNDLTDCWFVGYTPDTAAGVWTGHDQNINKVGGGETGGKAAAPIFLYYMQEFLKDKPVAQFKIPEGALLAQVGASVDVYPGDLKHLLPEGSGSGGADFFVDDL